jgi:hypothetical protein
MLIKNKSLNNRISDLKLTKKDNTNKNSVWNDKISELETELKGVNAKKKKNKRLLRKRLTRRGLSKKVDQNKTN